MKSRIWPWLILGLVVGCHKEDDEITEGDMWIYANRFFDEAAARNIDLDKSTLTIKFVEKEEIAPYAGYGTTNPPLVRIVKDFWTQYNNTQKEILMFHELGHAVLRRQHTNEMLPNCTNYKSMMMDGNQFIIYGSETDSKRQYYIDELFNPSTPYPVWSGFMKSNKNLVLDNPTVGWTYNAEGGSLLTGSIEDDKSLRLHGTEAGAGGQAFWRLAIPSEDFPIGSTIKVTIQVKYLNIVGKGAGVTLQPDLTKNKYFWTATSLYGGSFVGSNSDWQDYELTLNCYPSDEPEMFIYLYMNTDSTGDIWFRNIKVDYYN